MCRRFFFWVTIFVTVIVFWNLENYFDPFDDAVTMDDEFTPRGEKRWNWRRFERKRNGIAKVLLAAGSYGEVPAIAAFAEVENKMVLRQLLRETPLEKLDYDIIHRDSPDARGIDVGLIYRKSRFKPLDVRSIRVSEEFATRDILYVKGIILGDQSAPWLSGSGLPEMSAAGRDTIHIFVNHWPSKRGGAAKSQPRRDSVKALLTAFCDSILTADPCCRIIAMGDFNDTDPEAPPLHRCTPVPPEVLNSVSPSDFTSMLPASFTGIQPETADGGHPDGSQTIGGHPDNDHLAAGHPSTGSSQAGRPHTVTGTPTVAGTLKYRGRWEIIDHFFVSDALSGHIPGSCIPADIVSAETAGPVEGVEASDAQATADTQSADAVADAESVKPASAAMAVIFAPEFLLEEDKSYLGVKPRRTYIGPRYNGGVSDHLPILLKISGSNPPE